MSGQPVPQFESGQSVHYLRRLDDDLCGVIEKVVFPSPNFHVERHEYHIRFGNDEFLVACLDDKLYPCDCKAR